MPFMMIRAAAASRGVHPERVRLHRDGLHHDDLRDIRHGDDGLIPSPAPRGKQSNNT